MFADLPPVETLHLARSTRTQETKLFLLAARFRRKFLAFTPRMPLCYDRRAVLFASFIPSSKKESRTPKGADYRRNRRCGSRLAGRAHLPAFCRGSRQRDVAVPQAQHRAKLPGTWPRPVPVQWCTPRAGRSAGRFDARAARGAVCMAPPAGAALAPPFGMPSARRPS